MSKDLKPLNLNIAARLEILTQLVEGVQIGDYFVKITKEQALELLAIPNDE